MGGVLLLAGLVVGGVLAWIAAGSRGSAAAGDWPARLQAATAEIQEKNRLLDAAVPESPSGLRGTSRARNAGCMLARAAHDRRPTIRLRWPRAPKRQRPLRMILAPLHCQDLTKLTLRLVASQEFLRLSTFC